jgi:hypothetical protein
MKTQTKTKEDYIRNITIIVSLLLIGVGFYMIATGLEEWKQEKQNIEFEVSNFSANPELFTMSKRGNIQQEIITINTEICKPISCPQSNEGIYTLQMCFNCSEVLK